jgi:hypothetical protein
MPVVPEMGARHHQGGRALDEGPRYGFVQVSVMCLSDLLWSEQKQPSSEASRPKLIFANGAVICAMAASSG